MTDWDGSSWETTEPQDRCYLSEFGAVDASGRDDVWAVGNCQTDATAPIRPGLATSDPSSALTPMIERWDGTSWSMVDVPELAGAIVTDIAVVASDDVWLSADLAVQGPGILVHWDGSTWTSTETVRREINTLAAAGGDEAWVTSNGQVCQWSAGACTVGAPTGGYIGDVDALDQDDVWAIGGVLTQNLAARWDGTQWSRIDVPRGPAGPNWLTDVERVSGRDVWLVQHTQRPAAPVLHGHDGIWTKPRMPNDMRYGVVFGVVATAARNAWAFGNSDTGPNVAHGNGKYWPIQAELGPSPSKQEALWLACGVPGRLRPGKRPGGRQVMGTRETLHSLASRQRGTAAVAVLALVLVGVAGATSPASGTGRSPLPHRDPPGTAGVASGRLTGVKALAPDDVWIVGNRDTTGNPYRPVIRHFDGSGWTSVGHLESPPGNACYPTSIDGVADDDMWVSCSNETFGGVPMIEHWDGSSWHLQEIAPQGLYTDFWHIWVDTPTDVWAVGDFYDGRYFPGLVEHYDGETWTQMKLPLHPSSDTELLGIDGTSSTDVWAVGQYHSGEWRSFTMHYNGSRWTRVESPNGGSAQAGVGSVSVIAPNDVWAGGWCDCYDGSLGFLLHWDGSQWVHDDVQAARYVRVYGLSALSTDDVWAVGDDYTQSPGPVALHWDGTSWTSVPPREVGAGSEVLLAVSADSPNDVWTAGYWTSDQRSVRMYQRWDGTKWRRHVP